MGGYGLGGGRGLCHSVMMVGGGNPSSSRWGIPYPVMMRGTPSSHGGGTNPHLGWGDTIPGMGWVGVPHPSSWLSTLARGYLPWLGDTYLGQEGTSSNVGTYSQGIYPLPRVHNPPSPSTLTRGVPTLDREGMSLNEGTTASVGNP